jgi:hypothetical protein
MKGECVILYYSNIYAYLTSQSTYLLCWFRWRALLFNCSSLRRSCSAGSDHGESSGFDDHFDVTVEFTRSRDVDTDASGDSVSDDDDDEERGRHADAKDGPTFACLNCIRLETLVKVCAF